MTETYAIITSGVVTNIIAADANFAAQYYPGSVRIDNLTPVPGIGWDYSDGTFTRPS